MNAAIKCDFQHFAYRFIDLPVTKADKRLPSGATIFATLPFAWPSEINEHDSLKNSKDENMKKTEN